MPNPTRIPVLDLRPELETYWQEYMEAMAGVLKSGQFIMGPDVEAFEHEAAAYLGVKHAIGVNSGTDALVIALRSLGIGSGDEVITTPFTFFATAESISMVGATPVFVDVDPETFNIDPNLVEQAITPRTKAILPVHLYGLGAEMDAILDIARRHNLKVVEDVAQAFGGDYQGRKLGTLGDAGAHSFFPSKILGAFGDGGLLTTNDDSIAATARMLRVHGAKKKYHNEVLGYNSRLDTLQAAILRVKLRHVERSILGRRRAAQTYNEILADIPGLIVPTESAGRRHVYHQYTVRVLHGRRDHVKEQLQQSGIDTVIYYPVPVHKLPLYSGAGFVLPNAERLAGEVLSLPIWPEIDRTTQECVAQAIRRAIA